MSLFGTGRDPCMPLSWSGVYCQSSDVQDQQETPGGFVHWCKESGLWVTMRRFEMDELRSDKITRSLDMAAWVIS